MGAGDVKLMAAVGTFLGWSDALAAGLATLIIGAAIAILIVIWRQVVIWIGSRRVIGVAHASALFSLDLPYAFAIATGTVAALLVHV
jgi:prepilin peptidase CpaA